MRLITEYPLWMLLFCLLFAGVGSWFLYRNNPLALEGKSKNWLQATLLTLRFITLALISFLLLGPLLKWISQLTEKPVILIVTDNSSSIPFGTDKNKLAAWHQETINKFKQSFDEDYQVLPYLAGDKFRPATEANFNDRITNLQQVFTGTSDEFDNNNVGAIVLMSDGIYNQGENPSNDAASIKAPVYTIALGDTLQRKDVLVKQVRTNQVVYKGNAFPLEIDIASFAAAGTSSMLNITQNGKQVYQNNIKWSDNFFSTLKTNLTATEGGTQHIIVTVTPVNAEVSTANNKFELFINVIDGKQKIAIMAYTPHPDIGAYARTISSNKNYDVDIFILNRTPLPQQWNKYNLVLLHQIPGLNGEGLNIIKQLKESKVPLLYVLGAQTNISYLLQAEPLLQVSGYRGSMNEVLPTVQQPFSLFSLSESDLDMIKKFPPLMAPYGNYQIKGKAEILFNQQIGYIKTAYPLIFFNYDEQTRIGFICGEGFWKWSLSDLANNEGATTSKIMSGAVQFLAGKKEVSRFRITADKQMDEGAELIMQAEVYNETYQLIPNAEVEIELINSTGQKYNYTFSPNQGTYQLQAAALPSGVYQYKAQAKFPNNKLFAEGRFVVKPRQTEFIQTKANHQLLKNIAESGNGKMFYPNKVDELIKDMKNNEAIKPVIYEKETLKNWIDFKWLFAFILLILSVEWFIRKWNGSI
ncbi:MAG: hypothetical protein MUC81_05335 [Bacteroidia bacterium]|nr:hypothetical protein [Bacteroidia bacterium]